MAGTASGGTLVLRAAQLVAVVAVALAIGAVGSGLLAVAKLESTIVFGIIMISPVPVVPEATPTLQITMFILAYLTVFNQVNSEN
jgi:uncharacterized membrane protein